MSAQVLIGLSRIGRTPDKTKMRHTISYADVMELERRHYLTINFKNQSGKEHAVVFELGKDIVRTTLAILEARTGKKIQYQDDEARKSGKGGD
ncbi:MAG TPA: hypothetical protein VF491_10390 [Vicinamibacterales bacterium]